MISEAAILPAGVSSAPAASELEAFPCTERATFWIAMLESVFASFVFAALIFAAFGLTSFAFASFGVSSSVLASAVCS